MSRRAVVLLFAVFILTDLIIIVGIFGRPLWQPVATKLTGGRTVEQAAEEFAPQAEPRLQAHFENAGIDYPPKAITLIGLKHEKQLEVWAKDDQATWTLIHRYPVLAASGIAGPKLREGDKQVPEGIYAIESLNPNSSYHLSMKLDYPNAFDRLHAEQDGRDKPGTNIFIHGKAASVGCLAMGDPAIEELFVLVDRVGIDNTAVLLLPHDPRKQELTPAADSPAWIGELYTELIDAVEPFRNDTATHP